MMPEKLVCDVFEKPFPHLIGHNFYNDEELELIWEELKFYTKPDKLLRAKDFGEQIEIEEDRKIFFNDLHKDPWYECLK